MGDAGVQTEVTLECQQCGKEVDESSDDVDFNATKAIESSGWGWSEASMELFCDECLEKETDDNSEEG